MTYATQEIAEVLKTAREAKGLSQRALASLAGVPQSHISKIESGAVDLRLSSLVEIARALDLEVTLVPRKNLSAVQSIIRSSERPAPQSVPGPSPVRELQKLQNIVRSTLQEHPSVKELAQIQRQARDLQRLATLQMPDLSAVREAAKAVEAFRHSTAHMDELRRSLSDLQRWRNSLVHEASHIEAMKPAYSLEEDDHG